jgi:hypothetical protein
MNFSDLRNSLRENLLTVVDNVTDVFTHPEAMAELQYGFPYVTMVFGEGEVDMRRVKQSVSIIGFVEGEDDEIADKLIDLKTKVFNSIYNEEPKIVISSQDLTNVFKPFGLDAGVFPPYGAFRFECTLPVVMMDD